MVCTMAQFESQLDLSYSIHSMDCCFIVSNRDTNYFAAAEHSIAAPSVD